MTLRKRKCKAPGCDVRFQPFNSFQKTCSPTCALAFARLEGEKAARQEMRERKVRLKTRREWLKEAQAAFNAYIRERDHDRPCISCGTFSAPGSRGGDWDCGHYRSTGANPELRFCELNAAKQCKRCNQHLSGNVVNFRIHLAERIGADRLAWLEGPHPAQRYTIDELKAIRDSYRAKRRELEKQRKEAV